MSKILLPLINQISYLPCKLRGQMAPERYEQLLTDLAPVVAVGLETVAAHRAALEARQSTTPVKRALAVHYGTPRRWEIRLSHPLARTIFLLVQDLVTVDEQWARYAWNAEVGKKLTPDFLLHSELANYEKWQQKQLDQVRQLSQAIRVHLKKLRQAGRPRPAAR